MTEFSFDLFITPVHIEFISKFPEYQAMSYWKIWLFTGCAAGVCVLDIHLESVLVGTPILVTYIGISV